MKANNGKSARNAGGWAKTVAGLAVLAGSALWSGCDKQMESMARRIGAGALVSDDMISADALSRQIGLDEAIKYGSRSLERVKPHSEGSSDLIKE